MTVTSNGSTNLERELIPKSFTDAQSYVEELLRFLRQWSHFFQYTTTTTTAKTVKQLEQATMEEEDHVILFFKNRHYENRVPHEWRQAFQQDDAEHRANSDDGDENQMCRHLIRMARDGQCRDHWPQSLKRFVSEAKGLYLRQYDNKKNSECSYENNNSHRTRSPSPSDSLSPSPSDAAHEYNKREMIRGMSPKKQHEVHILARIIAEYSKGSAMCDSVLDIGSGKGYLSHVLAFDYGLNVLAIDHNEDVIRKSMEKSYRMIKMASSSSPSAVIDQDNTMNGETTEPLSKQMSKENKGKNRKRVSYKAISSHLTTDQTDFEELMSRMDNIPRDSKLCLIGLHTCGDLAPAMMKLFLAHDRAQCMVNVGCCYHRITERETDGYNHMLPNGEQETDHYHHSCCNHQHGEEHQHEEPLYPMSQFVKDQGGLLLTNGGKVLACAALDKWNTEQDALNNFRRNAHRCALEAFLHEYQGPPNQLTGHNDSNDRNHKNDHHVVNQSSAVYCIGSISDQYSTFVPYALQSIRTMERKGLIVRYSRLDQLMRGDEQELCRELQTFYRTLNPRHDERVTQLEIYWSLRALLGPLLEALIIVDRFLFLREQGVEADVVRAFDGELSPRNMVLLGRKICHHNNN